MNSSKPWQQVEGSGSGWGWGWGFESQAELFVQAQAESQASSRPRHGRIAPRIAAAKVSAKGRKANHGRLATQVGLTL